MFVEPFCVCITIDPMLTFDVDANGNLTLARTPPAPAQNENSNFPSGVQIWPYPEHPPPSEWKLLIFLSESKCDLTQNTHTHPKVAVEVCGDYIPQGYHLVFNITVQILAWHLHAEI